MKYFTKLLFFFLFVVSGFEAALAQSKAVENSIADVSDGVVQLSIYNNDNKPFLSLTGLVLTKDGIIATSAEAISKATWIGVIIDGKEYFATEVKLVDDNLDIALIKIEGSGFSTVNLSKTGIATPNKSVFELTNSGKEISYSEGIAEKPERVGGTRVLKTSFKFTSNQNGGALLDSKGKIVGMISTSLNGAVPIATLRPLLKKAKKVKSPVKTLAQKKPTLGPILKKTFYTNGAIQSERYYLVDVLEGVSKFYTEDSKLAIEETYKNNLRDGYSREYYSSGKPRSEATYKGGKRNGSFKTFFEDGKIETEATYENDVVVGTMKLFTYYPSGSLKEESSANTEGQLVGHKRTYFENGMLAADENYVVGVREGNRRVFYDNGYLEKAQLWQGGKQVGDEQVFFSDGKIKEENKFNSAGVMIESKIYDQRGRKIEDLDAGEIAERNKRNPRDN